MSKDERQQEVLMAEDAIVALAIELDRVKEFAGLAETSATRLVEAQETAKEAATFLAAAGETLDAARSQITDLETHIRTEFSLMNASITQLDEKFIKDMDVLSGRVTDLRNSVETSLASLTQSIESQLGSHRSEIEGSLSAYSSRLSTDIQGLQERTDLRLVEVRAQITEETQAIRIRTDALDERISASISGIHDQLTAMKVSASEMRKIVRYTMFLAGATLLIAIVIALLTIA